MIRAVGVTLIVMFLAGETFGYSYSPSDFATEVVEYVKGAGVGSDWLSGDPFDNAECALGRPTVDTTGDGWYIPVSDPVPVVPVYPSFRAYELVTIGNGGYLTVKFGHRVENDPNNPYGLDLIVFGNAFQVVGGGQGWENGDPDCVTVGGTVLSEPGIVSVSQDGDVWYSFDNGPWADDFAPTLGRVYDAEDPDNSIGDWNLWWGEPTDPTVPLDPSLTSASFNGWTVGEIARLYDNSAGGMGFDIGVFGLDWIQYVRVSDDPNSTATTEIDAFADVAPVPEPGTLALAFAASLMLLGRKTRRTKQHGTQVST
jgi:hypothetical protein